MLLGVAYATVQQPDLVRLVADRVDARLWKDAAPMGLVIQPIFDWLFSWK